jgi:hypothetical protein
MKQPSSPWLVEKDPRKTTLWWNGIGKFLHVSFLVADFQEDWHWETIV